jgi:hypothetical protein
MPGHDLQPGILYLLPQIANWLFQLIKSLVAAPGANIPLPEPLP